MTSQPNPEPHKGFGDLGERPWKAAGLPAHPGADPAAYGRSWETLANALSGFLDALAESVPGRETVEALAADLTTWSDKLKPLASPERDRVFGRRTDLHGRGQSMSPKLVVIRSDRDSVEGTVHFGSYFLGGNGAVHGGAIPLIFDEILGRLANSADRPPSRTAYLHTDFRSITPIGPDLSIRAWFVSEEGRKRILRATIHHGDTLCAEAEGLFVALRPGQP
ncbi:acyl-CoA thioesterase FadM [Actinocorallia herbida]|uniref:Acyl-coenzyme A thioesterase THEM4 n=1 Tax=Actinocorallia herbida TaxID=58109 RepID=A0A3N1D2Z8_9ACTN|nr:PaaI family thioesterase [Actinocorallia herbida]ROO87901.1 acyl-CoA thioesterase FadM [Actinocorallia herbida]